MAYVTHNNGEQLVQTRLKAAANLAEVVSTVAGVTTADLVFPRSGMGIENFRKALNDDFNFIESAAGPYINTFLEINDGDMLQGIRRKLNFNFSAIANNTELVTNGDFALATSWTTGTGWTVAGNGVASFIGAAAESLLSQASVGAAGTTYYLSITVANYVSLTGAIEDVTITSAGSGYTTVADHGAAVTFDASDGSGTLATGTLIVVGDVVTGVTITEGGTIYSGTEAVTLPAPIGGGTTATGTPVFTAGADGGLTPALGTGEGTAIVADGSYVQTITAVGTGTLSLAAAPDFRGDITSVSVKVKVS